MRFLGLPERALLLRDLAASRLDALAVERRNAKMARTIDCLGEWFARASRRADAMEKAQEFAVKQSGDLIEELAQKDAVLAQALEDLKESTGRILYLERELEDTVRGYQELKDAVQLAALKKKGAR